MATFSIYSKDGQKIRHSGEPQYSGSYMGVDYIEFRSISSPIPIDWERGDYVDYYRTGMRYKLYSLPMPRKIARRGEYGAAFEYNNVQFYSAAKELEIAPFRDIVTEYNNIHFSTRQDISTYEDVYGIARRIQACVDDIFPNRWRIEVFETEDADLKALFNEVKDYTLSNGSCLEALSKIYQTWKNVGWIHTYDEAANIDVITIGRANVRDENNTSDSYSYGMGKGLTSIKKAAANAEEFATRLYVYGSERNIQTRYYNKHNILNKDSVDIRNLMLPIDKWGKTDGLPDASKAFLQADNAIIEKYGLIPRTVYFDGSKNEEIYPSITGLTMAQVRQEMIKAGESSSEFLPGDYDYRIDQVGALLTELDNGSKEEVEKQRTVDICLHEVGFNIAKQGKLTSEGYAIISMTSGDCAGREFKVTKYVGPAYGNETHGSRIYRLERAWDESLGEGFPNTKYQIKSGDTFVLLDIPMPEFYITMAENRLYGAAEKMLADYTRVSAFYEPGIDSIKIKEGGKLLRAGMYMQVYDEDIIDTADNKDYVLIDSISIDEKAALPSYKITLREQKRSARTYSVLEDMIVDAKGETKEAIKRERYYTDRRFQSAQETLSLLQDAFSNYTDGISPATVRTMAMLVGDEGLQFKFTSSRSSLTEISCPIRYNESTKQVTSVASAIIHMTLDVNTVTAPGTRKASDYRSWNVSAFNSAIIEDKNARYVYIKANKNSTSATVLLSETAIGMEDVSGYYHFLVGILNSEINGTRDFITLYGFTEVLPGQITTDIIKSSGSNLVIDLVNAVIEAKNGATIKGSLTIGSGSSGLDNLSEWSGKQKDIDDAKNTANAAQEQADNAKTTADAAQRDADAAKETANEAKGTADAANKLAGDASALAQQAKGVADTANAATLTLDTKIGNIETGVNESVAEINARLDGVVENYFEEGAPELTNYPANEWVTDEEKANHVGDTYTNISSYEKDPDNAGKSWRWTYTDSEHTGYHWHPIADSDAVKALLEASKAQTAADGKSKVFVNKPKPPYKEGDLWVQGGDGDIMRCKDGVNRTTGSYVASDWELASKYTDDTAAIAAANLASVAKQMLESWLADGVITPVEKEAIRAELIKLENEYERVVADCNRYGIAKNESPRSDYETSYTDYVAKIGIVLDIDGVVDASRANQLRASQGTYYQNLGFVLQAISIASKKIADDANEKAEGAQNTANDAKAVANAAKQITDSLNDDNILTEVEKREVRKLIAQITECQSRLVTVTASVERVAKYGADWYLVNDKSVVSYEDDDTGEFFTYPQGEWDGYYSSNVHSNDGYAIQRLNIHVENPFTLKLQFGSDGEVNCDYLNVSALNKQVDVSSTVNNLTDVTKQASSYRNNGIGKAQIKSFAFDGETADNFLEVSYAKDGSSSVATDSGYYRIVSDKSFVDGRTTYIVEQQGSFHKQYLTLCQNGYITEANVLASKLSTLFTILNDAGLWVAGDSEVAEGFRDNLSVALTDYFSYVTEMGFSLSFERISDAKYLSDAFKNGRTIIDGGLVLSSMVAVSDSESSQDADVEAFLNGSDFAKDTKHGKLLIAGGIPQKVTITQNGVDVTSTDFGDRAIKASTRIYEDGSTYTKKLHLEDGCSVGALSIVEDAIYTEQESNGESYITQFKKDGISHNVIKNGVVKRSAEISGCMYYPLSAMVNGQNACHIPVKGSVADNNISETSMYAAICLDAPNGYSVYAVNGMFAGLRPKARSVSGITTLDEYDHTIFATSASADITLPSAPQIGQEYVILAPYGGVQIRGNGKNIRLFHDGVAERTGFKCGDVAARTEFRLYWTGTEWWATHTEN